MELAVDHVSCFLIKSNSALLFVNEFSFLFCGRSVPTICFMYMLTFCIGERLCSHCILSALTPSV